MKVCLGMIIRNEEEFLKLHLPILRPNFDKAVAINFSNDKSEEILDKFRFTVINEKWTGDFSLARNIVIKKAEELECTYIFMIDADELMFPECIEDAKHYFEESEYLFFPRIEFVKDREHINPALYPDFQGRAFKLNLGYHYKNRVHEALWKDDKKIESLFHVPNCHIFHYGKTKPTEFLRLKYLNYRRIEAGIPEVDQLPESPFVNPEILWGCKPVKFYGKQPL